MSVRTRGPRWQFERTRWRWRPNRWHCKPLAVTTRAGGLLPAALRVVAGVTGGYRQPQGHIGALCLRAGRGGGACGPVTSQPPSEGLQTVQTVQFCFEPPAAARYHSSNPSPHPVRPQSPGTWLTPCQGLWCSPQSCVRETNAFTIHSINSAPFVSGTEFATPFQRKLTLRP